MNPEIISLGEPMLEFNATQEGSLSEVNHFTVGWGGDTSNFAIAASRLGGNVGYLTRLGNDEFGDSFIKLWHKEGIDTSQVVRDAEAPSGIYFISRKGKSHHFTYYRKNSAASRMTPEFIPDDYIRKAKLLHVSGISQGISTSACDAVFAAIAAAKDADVLVSYDPNLRLKLWPLDRARAIIHQTVSLADIFLPSLEDAQVLTGMQDTEQIARFYLSLGPKILVLKLGAEGAVLAFEEERDGLFQIHIQKFSPYKVEPIDMTGAGDTFAAAFVVGYLSAWPLERCVRFANAAAALSTTGLGAVTPIPQPEAVAALMNQQKA
ncbi:MAG: sugar kinase [Desulfobacterales bacterium]|jgi:2-dehydro-3-deoxygluconokinase